MARSMRGCLTARSQQEGIEEPMEDPQQEDQPDITGGNDMEDYNLDEDYEGTEPKVKQSAQEQKEVDPDAEYANIEISQDGTLCKRMMPQEQYMGILWVHRAQDLKLLPQSFRICMPDLDLASSSQVVCQRAETRQYQ